MQFSFTIMFETLWILLEIAHSNNNSIVIFFCSIMLLFVVVSNISYVFYLLHKCISGKSEIPILMIFADCDIGEVLGSIFV